MRSGSAAARHGACDDDQQADVPVADALGFPIGMGTAGLVPLYKYTTSSTTVPTKAPLTKHRQTCLLYWTSWRSFAAVTAHARPAR